MRIMRVCVSPRSLLIEEKNKRKQRDSELNLNAILKIKGGELS